LTRYPYLLFFMERDDHIDVWRVLHGKRDIPAWLAKDTASDNLLG
jgi:toxin ParE1/3/4